MNEDTSPSKNLAAKEYANQTKATSASNKKQVRSSPP
jgi:hypothetical protein